MTSSQQTIRALAVSSWGSAPALTIITHPTQPAANQTRIRMVASGLPQLVRSQASGSHYSVSDAPLPYVPGIDGVGYTPENKLVYLNLLSNKPAPGGAFAEQVKVDKHAIAEVPLPENTNDEVEREVAVKVASLINPAMSSWMALKYRAHIDTFAASSQAWNVLVLGATSTSGRIAALFARHLGAKSVIGAARDAAALKTMTSNGTIDHAISLEKTDIMKTDFSILNTPELYPLVVLDYVYGSTALALLNALPRSARSSEDIEIRYVHIGTLGREAEIALPGPLLRAKNVSLSGSGPGAWSVKALAKETPGLVGAIVEVIPDRGWKQEYGVVERKLEDVGDAWEDKEGRSVFVMN